MANNIGNLEGKVVIDVSEAIAEIQQVTNALTSLAAQIEKMSKAQTVGPSVRNLDKLLKAAKAMETLQSKAQQGPAPSATNAASGGSVSGEVKLDGDSATELGKSIAAAVASALENQTISLNVKLNVTNPEELGNLKGLFAQGPNEAEGEQSGNGPTDRQKWDQERRQYRATNELTQALKRIQQGSSGATSQGNVLREQLKSFREFVNSGSIEAEVGPIRIEGTNAADQIADAVAKFFDKAPDIIRSGRGLGTVPIGELSSFASDDDMKELLSDFRDAVIVPLVATAKQSQGKGSGIDENRLFAEVASYAKGSEPPPSAGTRNAFDARLDALQAASAARREKFKLERPEPGPDLSDPTRIVSKTSAAEEKAKLDAMIEAGIQNKPQSYLTRDKAFERIRGLMEYEGQIKPLDVVGALKDLPYVGAPSSNVSEWERKRDSLAGTIAALQSATPQEYIDKNGRKRTDLGVVDPSTGLKVTEGNRARVIKALQLQLDNIGERPAEGPPMDAAAVNSALDAMGAGKGFRSAPKAVAALEPLFQLINRGELSDIGFHKESQSYFFPSTAAERMQLQRVGYGHDVTMGDRGVVTRIKSADFLRSYLSQQIADQVHREGTGSYDPTVRRLAGLSPDERTLATKTLVDRLMVGVGGQPSIASTWLSSAQTRPFAEQGTKFDQQSTGNRGDYEAQRNLQLKKVQDEIDAINATGRIGPKRQARLNELTALQSSLIGQGADLSAFEPQPTRPPKMVPTANLEEWTNLRKIIDKNIERVQAYDAAIDKLGQNDGQGQPGQLTDEEWKVVRGMGLTEVVDPKSRYEGQSNVPMALVELERAQRELDEKTASGYFEMAPVEREPASRAPADYKLPQAPRSEREPDFVDRIQSEANEAQRQRIESGFGLDAGVLWDQLDAQKKRVQDAIKAEIQDKILSGELLDPNDYAQGVLKELEPLSGQEKRDRASDLVAEGLAGFKEYGRATFGKDEDRRTAYDAEVKSRINGVLGAIALPKPGRAAQKPGGALTVMPRGPYERADPYLTTDITNEDMRGTGRGYRASDYERPLETTIERDKDVLRSKILNEFEDIGDMIPLDIVGIERDTDQARRRGQAKQGQAGAARADLRRARLGTEVNVAGDVTRYVPLTPEEEEARFGNRYRELEAAVNQFRKKEMAQSAARGVIRRSGLDETATLAQRGEFLSSVAADDRIPQIVKQEVSDLLEERNFGHLGEAIIKRSAQQRDDYVTGDDLRDTYAKGAPLSTGEMVGGAGGGGPREPEGGFAAPGVYKVWVENWPDTFRVAAGGEGDGGGPRRLLRRAPEPEEGPLNYNRPSLADLRRDGPRVEELGPPLPSLEERIAAQFRPARNVTRLDSRSRIAPVSPAAMRARQDETFGTGAYAQYDRPDPSELDDREAMTVAMVRQFAMTTGSRTTANGGIRFQSVPKAANSAAGREIESYEQRRAKAESAVGKTDSYVDRMTRPMSDSLVKAQVDSINAAQRQQSRSLGTSIISFVESLNPSRQQSQAARVRLNQRVSVARRLEEDQFVAIERQSAAREDLRDVVKDMRAERARGGTNATMPAELLARRAAAREEYRTAGKQISSLGRGIERTNVQIEQLAKEAGGLGAAFSTLATGAVGGVIGSLATMGVAGVAQIGTQIATMAIGPTLERIMGNPATTARVQGSLGQSVVESGGYTEAAVARTMAGTGIRAETAATLAPALEGRAQGVAASQQVGAQLDLIRTAARINAENIGYNGYDKSLFDTTGGLGGTFINGQASISEQYYDIMRPLTGEALSSGMRGLADILNPVGSGINPFNFKPSPSSADMEAAKDALDSFMEQVNASTSGLKVHTDAQKKDTAGIESLAKDAERKGEKGWAELIRSTGMSVSGYSGNSPFAEMMQRAAVNAPKPSASLVADSMVPQLKAQRFSEIQQLRFQTGTAIPQQWAIQQGFNPLVGSRYKADSVIRALARGTGTRLDEKALAQLNARAQGIRITAGKGRADAIMTGYKNLPAKDAKDFADALGEAASYGDQIANLRLNVQMRQASLAAAQFKESMRQAKIAAADALAMNNQAVPSDYSNQPGYGGNLGQLQRSDFQLGIQSARLGQAMTQRQINFQTAIAGFSAPGLTPEERAARIDEAKIEARFAQQQLNIQRKMTANQVAEFKITTVRNATIAAQQVKLLQQGQDNTVANATDEQQIAAFTALMQKPMEIVQASFQTSSAEIALEISAQAGIIAQTNESFDKVQKAVNEQLLPAISDFVAGLDTQPNTPAPSKPTASPQRPSMSKSVTNNVSVQVTTGSIGSQEDLNQLVNQVGVAIARKLAIMGLRGAL